MKRLECSRCKRWLPTVHRGSIDNGVMVKKQLCCGYCLDGAERDAVEHEAAKVARRKARLDKPKTAVLPS